MNIYTENILDLYKNPNNQGILENVTHQASKFNSLCGDEIKVFLHVENNVVKDVKFEANGCAISIASASMLTDKIKNLSKI